jgi:tetratricopeptide (TPR) repeat protein
MAEVSKRKWGPTATWSLTAIASLVFWRLEGRGSMMNWILVVSLSLSSFIIGALAGFLFTSYGEEASTVGKVRDWLIGGLTGLTIAKVGAIKSLLLTFAAGPGPQEFAVATGTAITYVGIGFFFMFFQRELILNVLLARSRAERGRVDGTSQAGVITQKLLTALPPRILSGIDDVADSDTDPAEAEELRKLLYSDDVNEFLKQADEAIKSGSSLDWDVVSKAANLHYYRTYFEKGEEQEERAKEWLLRALLMNPLHADLTAKYADVLGRLESYSEAVAVLEKLFESEEAPTYVQQWLGYYLLFVPGREDEAIRLSLDYVKRFPDTTDSLFNAACGYAQKYEKEQDDSGRKSIPDSENRKQALLFLKQGLQRDPDYRETVRKKWIKPDESFFSLANDPDFLALVTIEPSEPATTTNGAAHSDKPEPR